MKEVSGLGFSNRLVQAVQFLKNYGNILTKAYDRK
jgi:hypothetical protein